LEASPDPEDILKYSSVVQLSNNSDELFTDDVLDDMSFSFLQRSVISSSDSWTTNWNYEKWVNSNGA
jgi:hypothetical protein